MVRASVEVLGTTAEGPHAATEELGAVAKGLCIAATSFSAKSTSIAWSFSTIMARAPVGVLGAAVEGPHAAAEELKASMKGPRTAMCGIRIMVETVERYRTTARGCGAEWLREARKLSCTVAMILRFAAGIAPI
ncbi:hypothetical protein ACH5RR_040821 [Cinchona calisaya]|uniref:Uncharacterized protein n=1 Tax=Cinchona calisaya TaxID=153742 RepID=A0ABD2XSH2_9GENT